MLAIYNDNERSLDEYATRYLFACAMLFNKVKDTAKMMILNSCYIAFAYHSSSKETLLQLLIDDTCIHHTASLHWNICKQLGLGYWLKDADKWCSILLKIAQHQYSQHRNPNDCMLMYIILGKKALLLSLLKSHGIQYQRIYNFLNHDFLNDKVWQEKAIQNAFNALSKQKYNVAIAFFILAGAIIDAITICIRKLNDFQLALVIALLQPNSADDLYGLIIKHELLPYAINKKDAALCHICYGLLSNDQLAIEVLYSGAYSPQIADIISSDNLLHQSPCLSSLVKLLNSKSIQHSLLQRNAAFEYQRLYCPLLALEQLGTLCHDEDQIVLVSELCSIHSLLIQFLVARDDILKDIQQIHQYIAIFNPQIILKHIIIYLKHQQNEQALFSILIHSKSFQMLKNLILSQIIHIKNVFLPSLFITSTTAHQKKKKKKKKKNQIEICLKRF